MAREVREEEAMMLPDHFERVECPEHGDGCLRDGWPTCGQRGQTVRYVRLDRVATFLGDPAHPSWADYVATNLLDALSLVPDTGDWHGALRTWCQQNATGNLKPNRPASDEERES